MEMTVRLLKDAIIAKPSSGYLIDGFPRAVNQAKYFEECICEVSTVLFYDVPEEIMLERCLKRGETSGRSDDTADVLKNRVHEFFKSSVPVVDFYSNFNKVHKIDATFGVSEVYAHTKNALLPQTFFLVGPKSSGKS